MYNSYRPVGAAGQVSRREADRDFNKGLVNILGMTLCPVIQDTLTCVYYLLGHIYFNLCSRNCLSLCRKENVKISSTQQPRPTKLQKFESA
jgi:hypothetical protein